MGNKCQIALVIPCYNEASRGDFSSRLQKLNEELCKKVVPYVVIVDDGSKDNTFEIVKDFIEQNNLFDDWFLLRMETNEGKGKALLKGLTFASNLTPYVAYIDADLSVSPNYINDSIDYVSMNTIICGHRAYKTKQNFARSLAAQLAKLCNKYAIGVNSKDTQCPFKIIPSQGFLRIKDNLKGYRWIFDIELLWELERIGYCIREKYVIFKNMESFSLSTAKALVRCAKDIVNFKIIRFVRKIECFKKKECTRASITPTFR